MPAIGVENTPIQFVVPAPSVTVPATASEALVPPIAVRVQTIGEPAKAEQESPILTKAGQFVFADPGPSEAMVYRIDGCAANWMNGLLGARPAPRTIGLLSASSTPSDETKHPAAPSTPEGQPANVRAVVFATWASHGGPGGIDVVSVLNVMLLSLNVVVPLPDEIFKSPTTLAEATIAKNNR